MTHRRTLELFASPVRTDYMFKDIQVAVRRLVQEPGFTAVVVIALALGIGVNTTVFTLVNAVLFRGLPFEEPDRVMYLSSNNLAKDRTNMRVSYPDFRDWSDQSKSFKGLAGFSETGSVLTDATAPPERYRNYRMTANAFPLIGQKALMGREFLPEDSSASATPVCILGHNIWENRYGRDAGIVGKTVRIDDRVATVVGVMPKGMKFPLNADLWTPLVPTGNFEKREERNVSVFGRLADGVGLPAARKEMELIDHRLAATNPKADQGITTTIISYNDNFNGGQIHIVFLAMLGAVGFVLLIACANVANLLLARSLARNREFSIRAALGAGRWRIMRQLLVESVLLGLIGGVAGLFIAKWGVRAFDLAVANVDKPYWIDFRMDFTVFAYLLGICVLTGLLFGLAPAIQLSKTDLNSTLKEGGRASSGGARSRYLSAFLVVTEVALSLVLLVGAGLMVRSFLNAYERTSGVRAERFLTMRVSLPASRYKDEPARTRFYEQLETRLRAVPGAESSALVTQLPMQGGYSWHFEVEGAPPAEEEKRPRSLALIASSEYFSTMGVPILRGRALNDVDGTASHNTVIVDQRFASKYWPGQDPIGRRLKVLWEGERPWWTVVGVSQDFRQSDLSEDKIEPVIYLPYRAKPMSDIAIVMRAAVPPTSLSSAARRVIQDLDSELPVFGVATLQEKLLQQQWAYRVFGSVFAIFALIALLLSSVGLYAVMAYSVSRRTQEIGVRLAMGASSRNIVGMVLAHGMQQLGIGLVLGLVGAFGLARVLKGLLVGVTPSDPITFVTISAILLVVGLLACWLPARAAMKLDPTIALRYE